MSQFDWSEARVGVVLGAGHGIGCALTEQLLGVHHEMIVFASFRKTTKASKLLLLKEKYEDRLYIFQYDMTVENDIRAFFERVSSRCVYIDCLINAIGILDQDSMHPEKSLNQIKPDYLMEYFRVNAIATPLIAKHAIDFFSKEKISIFATLSAKVGSIEDNSLGGWYGYRASKAALNMFLKNIAIEYLNRKKLCIVLSLHPGTTKTDLSQPYIKKTSLIVHTVSETAINMLQVIQKCTIKESGSFFSWDGEKLPW
ncbi:MAG: SDR family NAD(P)-dependent oxidoreductase [Oligoflexales bacterium]